MRKYIKTLLVICIAYTLSACDLDILPDSSVSSDSYWKTEDDAKSAVNGLYSRLRGQLNSYKWMYWFEARACNIEAGLSAGGITAYNNNDIAPSADDTNWVTLYNIISQANAIIQNIDKVKYTSETTRNQYLAEASFVRSWCYFNLVRLWGDVPIVTNFISSLDDPQLYPERSPKSEVFNLLLADINLADELYTSKTIASRHKVSRASILMLKTEIYLWIYKVEKGTAEDLDKAETAIDELLSFSSSTLKLENNYSDVFNNENSPEIIFSIYYAISENTSQYGTLLAQSSTLVPAEYRNNPIPVGTSANHTMAFSNMFYKKYRNKTPGDTRAEFISTDMTTGGTNFRWTKKYMGEMNGNTRVFSSDTRVYRMAEAILYKAEILAERGNYPQAVAELNKVVKRAYGVNSYYPSTLAGEDFKETLLDERMIEFAGECKSWFDLIRFGKVFERVPSLERREHDKEGNILYLPVNENTISRNTKIKQTPGYD